MPELPEVETTRRGLEPRLVGRTIRDVVVRNPGLRWPIPSDLPRRLRGERVLAIRRRGKYLLFDCCNGHLLVHLGMSGRLSLVSGRTPAKPHDHVDVRFEGRDETLRFTDPRRFGAVLWIESPAENHVLLKGLGLEPFDSAFTGAELHRLATGRRVAVKQFLMNSRIVTGVGNIYASEALFRARIHPARAAGGISRTRWDRLARAVRTTLSRALAAGGTTLRDYASPEGARGGFSVKCAVYGREARPCPVCRTPIKALRQGQRSTFLCPRCQR